MPSIYAAAFWGALGASSVVLGAVLAMRMRLSDRVVGSVMGFGAGALIGAIAYELVPASLIGGADRGLSVAFAAGAATFFACDWVVGSRNRKKLTGERTEGSGAAIFLGAMLDGVPESLALGLSLALGGSISVALLAAVFVSNFPEGIAGTEGLLAAGYTKRRVLWMWVGLMIASAAAAALGFAVVQAVPKADGEIVQAFAAGAILTMLANAMMPEAFQRGGKLVGLLTALGFLMGAILSVLE